MITAKSSALRAVPMTLYPSFDTLEEVIAFAEAKMPIYNRNEMLCILMSYHNTLLKVCNVKS